MEALTCLKQNVSVVAYKSRFEILSNRIVGLSEAQKLSCFLSELKDEIRLPIRMLVLESLNKAFGLAKFQEEYLINSKKNFKTLGDHGTSWVHLELSPKVILDSRFHYKG